jgi:hypothetical protein
MGEEATPLAVPPADSDDTPLWLRPLCTAAPTLAAAIAAALSFAAAPAAGAYTRSLFSST